MNPLRALGTLALVLSALSLFAQQTPPAPSVFGETIEVRVINVDVVVTDKTGMPVRGLKPGDFEIVVNGEPREISNFLELSALPPAAAPAPAPAPATPAVPAEASAPQDLRSRKIILFFDASTLRPFNRNRVIPSMKNFLRENVRPGDQVVLAVWSNRLELPLGMTGSVAAVEAELDRVAGSNAYGAIFDAEERNAQRVIRNIPADYAIRTPPEIPPIHEALFVASAHAAKRLHHQKQTTEAIRTVIAATRGMEGRKLLVLLTESLSQNPAVPIYLYAEQFKDKFLGGPSTNFRGEAAAYADHSLVKNLTDAANSAGVTLYTIDAGGLGADFGSIGADSLAGEFNAMIRTPIDRNEQLQTLRTIADFTGGASLTGSNNFDLAFRTIANDLGNYYSLGYRASGKREDAVRTIAVRLKNKRGLTVRVRQELVEKSLTSEMKEAVAANLFYPKTKNDVNVTATAGMSSPAGDKRVVPVTVKIPMASLTLVPEGTDLVGSFSTFAAFVRNDGAVSDVTRQTHAVRFPADSLKRRREITLQLDMTIDDRTDAVSVGVMDDASQATGFVSLRFDPPKAAAAPATN